MKLNESNLSGVREEMYHIKSCNKLNSVEVLCNHNKDDLSNVSVGVSVNWIRLSLQSTENNHTLNSDRLANMMGFLICIKELNPLVTKVTIHLLLLII